MRFIFSGTGARSEPHENPDLVWICRLFSVSNPLVQIRLSSSHLISTMGFPILVRWHLYIASGPWFSKRSAVSVFSHGSPASDF